MTTMKAVRIHQYGGPEVLCLEDAPKPQLQAGEVLVRVHAAGINPVDWKTRNGGGIAGLLGKDPFPLVVGWDISGVVVETAPDVTRFTVGDAVYGMPRFPAVAAAYAEYVASPATHLSHKPETLTHVEAAALPLAALTAWQALFDAAGLQPGQTTLIHAAAGGVGHLAVQLAKWKGARIIGTASARNADFLHGIGVDEVIDYKSGDLDALLPVDVVLNTVDPETANRSINLVKPGGVLVSIAGQPNADAAVARGIRVENILVHTDAGQLAEIAQVADAGTLKPKIARVFPLEQAAQAHSEGAQGHVRGKLVLEVTR